VNAVDLQTGHLLKAVAWGEWRRRRTPLIVTASLWVLPWILGAAALAFLPDFEVFEIESDEMVSWRELITRTPFWLFAVGWAVAYILAAMLGSSDVVDGTEEFTFSLPVTRGELYWGRFLFGGGLLLTLLAVHGLLVGADLPRIVGDWLGVQGGTNGGKTPAALGLQLLYGLTIPVALYMLIFAISSIATGRGSAAWAGYGPALAIWVLYLATSREAAADLGIQPGGALQHVIFLAPAALAVGLCARAFRRKAASQPGADTLDFATRRRLMILAVAALVLGVLASLGAWFAATSARRAAVTRAERERAAAAEEAAEDALAPEGEPDPAAAPAGEEPPR
jgi:hypothetical protein